MSSFASGHPSSGCGWISGKGEVVFGEDGGARWLCGVYRDITDRKELDARLLALSESLEARVIEGARRGADCSRP